MDLWNLQKRQLPAVALLLPTAASDRLPHQSSAGTGTVVNREQLRRQMSEDGGLLRDVSGPDEPATTSEGNVYTRPHKVRPPQSKGESQARSRHVMFADSPASSEERRVQISRSFVERTAPPQPTNQKAALCRQVSSPVRREESGEGGAMDTHVSLYEDQDGKVKGLVELSTLRQRRVPHIKVRVICLIDVSGSMLHKGDKQQRRSKISILKTMAVDIIDALEDEEDFFGVMTFGEETRVLCPLTRVTSASRAHVKSTVSDLDKSSGFSAVTDLSSALIDAVHMLTTAQQDEGLLYRNCIIVFSDGEINAGETDPRDLVHLTREKIRECRLPRDMLADLWVNISCVTTGTSFSQPLYLLSKMCGSDAYFYVDGSKNFPEADMMIPLMLRKMACAQMVSVSIRASNGALLETHKCSQEYSVRRRGGREVSRDTMAYFIHDLPSGIQKTFQVSLDLEQFSSLDKDFLSVDVQYVDPLGVLYTTSKTIHRQDVVSVTSNKTKALEIVAKTAMNQLRHVLQKTCRQVATVLETTPDDPDAVKGSVSAAVQAGKGEADAVVGDILSQLEAGGLRSEFERFAKAVKANLSKLQSLVENNSCSQGKCWQYTKAISSAVARELPTVTNVVAQSAVVCPLPKQGCDSKRTQALSIYVLGEEGEGGDGGSLLHDAAKDVAKCLADVLKAMGSATI